MALMVFGRRGQGGRLRVARAATSRARAAAVACLVALVPLAALAAQAEGPATARTEDAKLLASDMDDFDQFGYAVAVSGDTVVVGARHNNDLGYQSGSAYVFVRGPDDVWRQQAKLLASDGAAGDRFGWDVAVDGDTIVVGAPTESDKVSASGSAYVFRRGSDGTWTQEAKLAASDAQASDQIGQSVGVSGDLVVVSAHGDDDRGNLAGAAYVFHRSQEDTWSQEAKLHASDGKALQFFGWAVALDGDTAAVNARWDDAKGARAGAVYVFQRSPEGTWTEDAKLTASDGAAGEELGYPDALAVSGDLVAVGSWLHDDGASNAGAAYVFARGGDGTWAQEAKLLASDAAQDDWFGFSVGASGRDVVVGAYLADHGAHNSGAAYLFHKGSLDGAWAARAKLVSSRPEPDGRLGYAVGLDRGLVVVGTPNTDDAGSDTGAAYVYDFALTMRGQATGAQVRVEDPGGLGLVGAQEEVLADTGPVVTTREAQASATAGDLAAPGLAASVLEAWVDAARGSVASEASIASARIALPTGSLLEVQGLRTRVSADCAGAAASVAVGRVVLDGAVLHEGLEAVPPNTALALPQGIAVVLNAQRASGEVGLEAWAARITMPGALDVAFAHARGSVENCP